VDVRGKPLELPEKGNDLGVTSVVREGQPVAALIHDPAFLESDGLTKVLAATSFMLPPSRRNSTSWQSMPAAAVQDLRSLAQNLSRNEACGVWDEDHRHVRAAGEGLSSPSRTTAPASTSSITTAELGS
jgi:hypothetical protein